MLIPRSVFHVADCASTEMTRYCLQGLHIERDGKHGEAVATDGKILLSACWEDQGSEFPVIDGISTDPVDGFKTTLPAAVCKEAQKAAPRKTPNPLLTSVLLDERANGTAKLASTDLEKTSRHEARTYDDPYPNYKQAIPGEGEPSFSCLVDPRLMIDLLKAMLAVHDVPKSSRDPLLLRMELRPNGRPIIFKGDAMGIRTVGGVMPVVRSK